MAYDPELERLVNADLAGFPDLSEKAMFGGLAWLTDGRMICVAIGPGLMARVGKANEAEALAESGVAPMMSGARRMGGWVLAERDAWADDAVRRRLLAMAAGHVLTLEGDETASRKRAKRSNALPTPPG